MIKKINYVSFRNVFANPCHYKQHLRLLKLYRGIDDHNINLFLTI